MRLPLQGCYAGKSSTRGPGDITVPSTTVNNGTGLVCFRVDGKSPRGRMNPTTSPSATNLAFPSNRNDLGSRHTFNARITRLRLSIGQRLESTTSTGTANLRNHDHQHIIIRARHESITQVQ